MAKALTNTQVAHLDGRIDDAINKALDKYRAKLSKPVYLTEEDKVKILKANKGGFKFHFSSGGVPYNTSNFISFDANVKAQAQAKQNDAAVAKFKEPLLKEKQKVIDRAILGGAEEALLAMEAFIAKLSK